MLMWTRRRETVSRMYPALYVLVAVRSSASMHLHLQVNTEEAITAPDQEFDVLRRRLPPEHSDRDVGAFARLRVPSVTDKRCQVHRCTQWVRHLDDLARREVGK